MRTLGLIPARMGSQRIPDKNLQVVNGRPLAERAVICAKAATKLDIIVVSSDDERVKLIADAHDVAFLIRPDELARDDSPMSDVVRHAIDNYDGYDAVCILEPTTTFRRARHVDGAVELLSLHPEASAVRAVTDLQVPDVFVHRLVGGFLVPVIPEAYDIGLIPLLCRDNGIANVIRVSVFEQSGRLFDDRVLPYVIREEVRGLDIDTPAQLAFARRVAPELDRA